MLTSCLPKLPLGTIGSTHRGRGRGRGVWRWTHRALTVPVGHLRGATGKVPPATCAVCDTVSRIHLPLVPSDSPICRSPSLSRTPVMQLTAQYSGWSKRETGFLGRVPHCWGGQVLLHMLSLSPAGEITGQENDFWH